MTNGRPSNEIDWTEFWAVVKGNGPLNRERVGHKRAAWDDNAWVREAASAYAAKRARDHLEVSA